MHLKKSVHLRHSVHPRHHMHLRRPMHQSAHASVHRGALHRCTSAANVIYIYICIIIRCIYYIWTYAPKEARAHNALYAPKGTARIWGAHPLHHGTHASVHAPMHLCSNSNIYIYIYKIIICIYPICTYAPEEARAPKALDAPKAPHAAEAPYAPKHPCICAPRRLCTDAPLQQR